MGRTNREIVALYEALTAGQQKLPNKVKAQSDKPYLKRWREQHSDYNRNWMRERRARVRALTALFDDPHAV